MSGSLGIVLLIERPGAFLDALVQAVANLGAEARTSETVLDALATFDLGPRAIAVANDVGPPGAGAICRMAQRKLPGITVLLLADAAAEDDAKSTAAQDDGTTKATQVVSRALGARAIGALLVPDGIPAPALAQAPATVEATGEPSPQTGPDPRPPAETLEPEPPPSTETAARPASGASLAFAPESVVSSASDDPAEPPPSISGRKRSGKSGRHAKVGGAAKRDRRFEEVEHLVERGAWDDIADKLQPLAEADNLPPRLALLYAIAAKESAREGTAASADAAAIRAVSLLFDVQTDSPAAVLVAKRALRRNPAAWATRPAPTAGVSIAFAVTVVTIVGFIAFLLGSGRLQLF